MTYLGVAMKEREKASDIFNDTDHVFSKKVSFNEAFPQLEDYTIEVLELEDMMWGKEVRTRLFNRDNPPVESVDCSNHICYSGGISIGSILRNMVREGKTEEAVTEKCRGYEGSPKGQKRYRSCAHFFKVKVKLKYKDSPS